jgi:hypothetical protein
MNYFIDIEDSLGNKFGDGALTSALEWKSTNSLDSAGTFSFSIPASDTRSNIIQSKRIARCYTRVGNAIVELGSGIIDKIVPEIDSSGNVIKKISGADLLRELTYKSVGFLNLSDGNGNGVTNAISQIMALAPTGWSIDSSVGTQEPASNVYGSFSGETVLSALKTITDNKGEHFRIQQGRKIAWLGTNLLASGIRAVQDGDPISIENNDSICIVQELEEEQDTYSICTRIYPYGSGVGDSRLTLVSTTRTVPAGYSLDKTNNCLINVTAEAEFGRIDKYISFKQISPISNTDLDLENASNSLFDQSLVYLQRHSKAEKFYKLKVLKLNKIVLPGQTIRVVFKRIIDGYTAFSIDQDLYILETTNQIDSSGIRTSEIKVATIDRFAEDENTLFFSQLEQSRTFETHPQLNANSYVVSYREAMDNSKSANIDFWLGREVLNVHQVCLMFRVDPLRSTIKSVAGQSSTSSSGGGGTSTSSSCGGGSVTSGAGGGRTVSGGVHGHGNPYNPYSYGEHAHVIDSHYHSVSFSSHSHNVSMGSHNHEIYPVINAVYGIYEENSANALTEADLIYSVNGSDALGRAVSIGGNWYEIDVTSLICNEQNFRPLQQTNKITISTAIAKTCTITGQLLVRTTIQAIAVL